jgi:hypothetical protein
VKPLMISTIISRRYALLAIVATLFILVPACSSKSSSRERQAERSTTPSPGAHVDIMCIGDYIGDPKEPFHYSYKYSDASRSVDDEADVTPQSIDATTKDESGTHSYHAVRTEDTNWGSTTLVLLQGKFTVMSGRLEAVNDTSAIRPQSAETINGYATRKYAIDTGMATPADQQQQQTLLGKGAFEKGTVWMGNDGCAVKLVLDEGVWQQDGTIKKTHYEIARIRR